MESIEQLHFPSVHTFVIGGGVYYCTYNIYMLQADY
ncbi:MAG: hypothetical protein ACI90V_011459, partial [Bacillariaceae sp.]